MTKAASRQNSSRLSITFALSTLMVAISVLLAGFLVFFNYQRNHDAALLAAGEVLAALAQQIEDQLLTLVRPIAEIAELAPELAPIGIADDGLVESYHTFLTRLVVTLPQVSSVYIGLADGAFFQIASPDTYSSHFRERHGIPQEAATVRYDIEPDAAGKPHRIVRYFDAGGVVLGEAVAEPSNFDPRKRPWYTLAMENEGVAGTPPYRFASSGELGVTVARQLPGSRLGVLGVDITLVELTRFLESQKPTDDSRLYLFTDAGIVLAWVGEDDLGPALSDDGKLTNSLPSLGDFRDPFAQLLQQSIAGDAQLPPLLEQNQQTFVTRLQKLIGPLGSTNYVGVLVPANHFTGPIIALGRNSALISVFLVLATVPLIMLASRAFSKPLHELATEADAIRAFELEGPVEVRSRIREIQALSTSMDRMKSGLRTFGLYVPKDLTRQMMDRPTAPELGGERRNITILFTDIAGFTPIAEGLEPEVVMQRMSAYFETLTAILRAHGGTIDKFIGDAVMAFWNGLVEDPAHAHSGCRAILAASAAIADLNARLIGEGLAPMPTRFGLHTGEAVVGNVGSSERMNFTALGATVNLAARLEPLNKVYGTEILVSEQIAKQVDDEFLLRSVAIVRPKGVAQPLRVYELLAERGKNQNFSWLEQWETAFSAFSTGDLPTASQNLRSLENQLGDDPVRSRLLERATKGANAEAQEDWSAVDVF